MIDAILTNTVLPQISRELLGSTTQDKRISVVNIDSDGKDFQYHYTYK